MAFGFGMRSSDNNIPTDKKTIVAYLPALEYLFDIKIKKVVLDKILRKRPIFKPEFINRLDEAIVFHHLSESEIKEIVEFGAFSSIGLNQSDQNVLKLLNLE